MTSRPAEPGLRGDPGGGTPKQLTVCKGGIFDFSIFFGSANHADIREGIVLQAHGAEPVVTVARQVLLVYPKVGNAFTFLTFVR